MSFPHKASAMGVYAALLGLTVGISYIVPGGFVPAQDKQYLISFAQLPNGASLDRTEAVIRKMSDTALKQPGVKVRLPFLAYQLTVSPIAQVPVLSL